MRADDTTVIIPTLNEAGNIEEVLNNIKSGYPRIRIIVVDDGSTDGTRDIVLNTQDCWLIDRSDKYIHGLTISAIAGIFCVDRDYLIVMDGDGQHPTSPISKVITQLRAGSDIVVCTRNKNGGLNMFRRCVSFGANFLGKLSLYLQSSPVPNDVVSGYFGIRTNLAKQYTKDYSKFKLRGYKILFDILKQMHKSTILSEVYYDFGIRETGSSKMGLNQIKLYFISLFK